MRYRIFGPKGHLIVRKATAARVKQILPALRRRFGHIRVVALIVRPKPRERVAAWARWGARHEPLIHYTELLGRSAWLLRRPGFTPLYTDCSGFATACYRWARLPDPNGFAYRKLGYTGTLLDNARAHGRIVDVTDARTGDLIVIGPGTGDHVVVVVEPGFDPLVVSHGSEGGPTLQRLSVDRRTPKRVCVTLP